MLGEFTPVSQRGAVIAIYGAIYTLAGILAPAVMGSVIQRAAALLDGYMTGFTINAVVMIVSGLLGLLLLWPNTERARLMWQQRATEIRVTVTRSAFSPYDNVSGCVGLTKIRLGSSAVWLWQRSVGEKCQHHRHRHEQRGDDEHRNAACSGP